MNPIYEAITLGAEMYDNGGEVDDQWDATIDAAVDYAWDCKLKDEMEWLCELRSVMFHWMAEQHAVPEVESTIETVLEALDERLNKDK